MDITTVEIDLVKNVFGACTSAQRGCAWQGGWYFCVMPQVFFSFVFPILAEQLESDAFAMKQYEKRRAEFLVSDVRDLFVKAFPDCEISAVNQRWLSLEGRSGRVRKRV